MSKSTQEYFDILKEEWSTFPELSSLVSDVSNAQELFIKLTTASQVDPHDLMLWVQATGCAAVDAELHHTLVTILNEMPKLKYGSFQWYAEKAKEFQYGDTIEYSNGRFFYPEVDLSHRIVAQAAAVPIAQGVRLKVAKLSGGELTTLSIDEMAALNAYFYNPGQPHIKPAGVHLVITTGIPDLLRIAVRIIRNPQVLAADGSLLSNPAQFPVEDAIKQHIRFLPYDGVLNLTKLEDAIQNVTGVLDVEIDTALSKYGSFDWQAIDLTYKADAGYMRIDPDMPLSTTISYQL